MVATTRNWEQTFRDWSKPSSDTEAEKCDRAERMIREAIRQHPWFAGMQPRVYAKGSYANNTNVRLDSDVDVAIEFERCLYFNANSVSGFIPAQAGIRTPADHSFAEFKNQTEAALVSMFGRRNVTRGNKAFDIHENTSRVDADAVPCWEYRLYYGPGPSDYYRGTEFVSDDGIAVVGWPEQQKVNGNAKNVRTGSRYKHITRAIKRLRNEMASSGIVSAEPIASYLIECLMYNVSDSDFQHPNYVDDVRMALASVIADQRPDSAWVEVNGTKSLYGSRQSWTRAQTETFATNAYIYCRLGH